MVPTIKLDDSLQQQVVAEIRQHLTAKCMTRKQAEERAIDVATKLWLTRLVEKPNKFPLENPTPSFRDIGTHSARVQTVLLDDYNWVLRHRAHKKTVGTLQKFFGLRVETAHTVLEAFNAHV